MLTPLFPMDFAQALIPVDCTPASTHALVQALRFVTPMNGTRLTLLASYAPVPVALAGGDAEHLNRIRREHAHKALQSAADTLRDYGIACQCFLRPAHDLVEALIAQAKEQEPCHFVLIGAHWAHPDIERPCAPTDADRVLNGVRQPVLVLPAP